MEIVNIALELMMMTALGILARRVIIRSEEFTSLLTKLLMDVIVPAVVIESFYQMEFSVEELKNCGFVLLLSVLTVLVLLLLGQIAYILFHKNYLGRILRFGIAFTNFSAFGFPVVEPLLGTAGLFYYVLFTILMRLLYYGLAQVMLCPREKRELSLKKIVKGWCTPPILANVVGIFLFVTQMPLPTAVVETIGRFADCCMPIGMTVTGMIIGGYQARQLLKKEHFYLPIARNILVPAIIFALLYFLPLQNMMKNVIFIYCAMPCGLLLAPYSLQYDPTEEAHLASAGGVLFSTLFATFSVPLWMLLVGRMF